MKFLRYVTLGRGLGRVDALMIINLTSLEKNGLAQKKMLAKIYPSDSSRFALALFFAYQCRPIADLLVFEGGERRLSLIHI